MYFSTNLQLSKINGLFNELLVEMPTILDNFIYQIVNTISTSIGVVHESHGVVRVSDLKFLIVKWPQLRLF